MCQIMGGRNAVQVLTLDWGAMHVRVDGPEAAPAIVFANSLGTDLRLWDAVLPLLPGHRAIRFDLRGHGLSDVAAPFAIEDLARDAARLIESVAGGPVIFVGLSIGGMIGQALAAARPDLLRGLVLACTATRMGTAEGWRDRIAAVEAGGIDPIAEAVLDRWFAPGFRARPELPLWRAMLTRTPAAGYAAACAAIAGADLTAAARAIDLPALVIAGAEDGAAPPDQVAALAALIAGASFHVIPGAGHLPPVETPEAMAALLRPFLTDHAG